MNAMYFGVGGASLGFECGDLIDIVFNLDINDYKNIQTVQLIIRDTRLAYTYTKRLEEEKERYSQVKNGGDHSVAENFIPTRDDCARVYTTLRKEYRSGNSLTDTKSLLKVLNQSGTKYINYVKLKYIFDIFNELQICNVSELGEDIYSFEVMFQANKTSIDKSAILKRLRAQCSDRNQQEAK